MSRQPPATSAFRSACLLRSQLRHVSGTVAWRYACSIYFRLPGWSESKVSRGVQLPYRPPHGPDDADASQWRPAVQISWSFRQSQGHLTISAFWRVSPHSGHRSGSRSHAQTRRSHITVRASLSIYLEGRSSGHFRASANSCPPTNNFGVNLPYRKPRKAARVLSVPSRPCASRASFGRPESAPDPQLSAVPALHETCLLTHRVRRHCAEPPGEPRSWTTNHTIHKLSQGLARVLKNGQLRS
jgi:hypothetical protein